MIERLRGPLMDLTLTRAIVDAGGVGYGVAISPQTSATLANLDGPVELVVHTNVYETGLDLYGFLTSDDKEVFLKLTGVKGIGPKLALTITSGMEPEDLLRAVSGEDFARLVRIPGVGKRTAERMVVELKDVFLTLLTARQLRASASVTDGGEDAGDAVSLDEVRSALLNFGYKAATVNKIVPQLSGQAADGANLQELIREALKVLQR